MDLSPKNQTDSVMITFSSYQKSLAEKYLQNKKYFFFLRKIRLAKDILTLHLTWLFVILVKLDILIHFRVWCISYITIRAHLNSNCMNKIYRIAIDPRGQPQSRPVVITIFTQSVRQSVRTSVCLSVRLSQNFKIKRQSLPAGTVGWPSGSLMTPVL